MLQSVLPEYDIQGDRALFFSFLQGRDRIRNVLRVLERLQTLEILRRHDGRDRLAVSMNDDALSCVLRAPKEIGELILNGAVVAS